jgi:hypothetical protein
MKNFSEFIKEEIDLRGSEGIPSDFMRKSEEEARRNIGIRPDDPRQMGQYGPMIMNLIERSRDLMRVDENGVALSREQIEDRRRKLENLAKEVIMSEYGDILEASEKPVELRIKLVDSGNDVNREISELRDVPAESDDVPEDDQEQDQQEQDQQEQDQQEQDQQEDQEQDQQEDQEQEKGSSILSSVHKKKILNMMTQGEGKMTKDIIKASDVVENGLREIFGRNWQNILNVWSETSDVADKMDWIIPVSDKAQMMKNQSIGMAGACDVTWESINNRFRSLEYLTENKDFNKIIITAVGIDFPMLIHEAVKGIYRLLSSAAIKKDDELAKAIKAATTSFEDEAQDFRYGVTAQRMFNLFVNACENSDKYSQMRARVFAQLALDKERGGRYSDSKFLEISKSLFSVFDMVDTRQGVDFVINQTRFNESLAKSEIQSIINDIVKSEDEYQEELRRWDADKAIDQYSKEEPESINDDEFADDSVDSESDIDALIRKTSQRENDISQLSQREIQELIDDALDAGDYDEVKRLSEYLKEGKQIYLREIERINESHFFHNRR